MTRSKGSEFFNDGLDAHWVDLLDDRGELCVWELWGIDFSGQVGGPGGYAAEVRGDGEGGEGCICGALC